MTPEKKQELEARCLRFRRELIQLLHRIQTGHPGGSLSCTEILTTVGCHGSAERRHGLSCDIVDFRSGCKGSNHTGTKHVDSTL